LLLVVIVFYASCGRSGSADDPKKTASSPSPTASSPEPEPTETLLTPEPGGQPENPPGGTTDTTVDVAPTGVAPPPQAPVVEGPCTDEEMAIVPIPAKNPIARKTQVDIRLKIENSGTRSCSRDVGADLQELRIVRGAETIWSSDHCGPSRGSDVRTFRPGTVREYGVTWNGKSSAKCSSGVPTGVVPPAGQYQLIARLGTKHSTPVVLTVS
jgi:hypothetical protein